MKKRREERLTLSAVPGMSDEAEYNGEYAAPLLDWTKMAQGLSKVSAMLERMEELDKKWSGAKERGTPDDGRSRLMGSKKGRAVHCRVRDMVGVVDWKG